MKYAPSEYAKAIVGALLAGLTALATALADDEGVADVEWVGIAVAVVATFGGVYRVRNRPPRQRHRSQLGHFDPWALVGAIVVAAAVVWLLSKAFGGD